MRTNISLSVYNGIPLVEEPVVFHTINLHMTSLCLIQAVNICLFLWGIILIHSWYRPYFWLAHWEWNIIGYLKHILWLVLQIYYHDIFSVVLIQMCSSWNISISRVCTKWIQHLMLQASFVLSKSVRFIIIFPFLKRLINSLEIFLKTLKNQVFYIHMLYFRNFCSH